MTDIYQSAIEGQRRVTKLAPGCSEMTCDLSLKVSSGKLDISARENGTYEGTKAWISF